MTTMPVNPKDILAIATDLSKQSTEAADRSAVSRAYYCVYHQGLRTVKAKLPPAELEKKYSKGCHQQLRQRLLDGKTADWLNVADQVEWLREARVSADYHLRKRASAFDTKDVIRRARLALKALEAL
jgi:hypothetical protein